LNPDFPVKDSKQADSLEVAQYFLIKPTICAECPDPADPRLLTAA
jgi:hypothetical protein